MNSSFVMRHHLHYLDTRSRFLVEQLCGKTLDRVPVFWFCEKLARALARGRNIPIIDIVFRLKPFDLAQVTAIIGTAKLQFSPPHRPAPANNNFVEY